MPNILGQLVSQRVTSKPVNATSFITTPHLTPSPVNTTHKLHNRTLLTVLVKLKRTGLICGVPFRAAPGPDNSQVHGGGS